MRGAVKEGREGLEMPRPAAPPANKLNRFQVLRESVMKENNAILVLYSKMQIPRILKVKLQLPDPSYFPSLLFPAGFLYFLPAQISPVAEAQAPVKDVGCEKEDVSAGAGGGALDLVSFSQPS